MKSLPDGSRPASAEWQHSSRKAADAVLEATLGAMRREPSRYPQLVLRMAEAELRRRRRNSNLRHPAADTTAHSAPSANLTEPATSDYSHGLPMSQPDRLSAPVVSSAAPNHRRLAPCRSDGTVSGMALAAGVSRSTLAAVSPRGVAPLQMAAQLVRSMSTEERLSASVWTGLVVLLLVTFMVWSPAKPQSQWLAAGKSSGAVVVWADPTRLTISQLAARPNEEIVRLIEHADAGVRSRALAALIRRQAVDSLLALRRHPEPGVRAAIPLAMLSLGKAAHCRIPELTEGLDSADEAVRHGTAYALRTLVAEFGPYTGPANTAQILKSNASQR